jgi:hypothetical protein
MLISSVSNNWISLFDYYQLVSIDIDSSFKTNFNINDYIFIDNLHGNSNIMLPIYINPSHWQLTKKYWTFHMGFINKGFEFDYNKKMDNIYFLTILKNIGNIIINKNNQNSIRLFFYILRTCIQICIDNKYSYNNKADYNKHLTLLVETIDIYALDKIFIDYIVRLIQVIITGNISEEEVHNNMSSILNTYIKHSINIDYTPEQIEEIKNMNDEDKNKEINEIITKYNLNILCYSELSKDLIFFNNLIKYIYSIKRFNQLIKYLDKYNGCLPLDENDLNCDIIDAYLTQQLLKTNEKIIDEKQVIIKTGIFI